MVLLEFYADVPKTGGTTPHLTKLLQIIITSKGESKETSGRDDL